MEPAPVSTALENDTDRPDAGRSGCGLHATMLLQEGGGYLLADADQRRDLVVGQTVENVLVGLAEGGVGGDDTGARESAKVRHCETPYIDLKA